MDKRLQTIRAGDFRHRVDLYRRKSAPSEGGRTKGEECVAAKIPCEVHRLSGNELLIAQQVHAHAKYRLRMRAARSVDIRESHWFTFADRTGAKWKLNIGSVDDIDQRGVLLEILCGAERVA